MSEEAKPPAKPIFHRERAAFRTSIYGDRNTAEMFQAGMDGSRILDPADRMRFDF